MKKIILTFLSVLTLAFTSVSCVGNENGLNLFKSDVQLLVKQFINDENPKEEDLVGLLNKEFGKEILKVENFEGQSLIKKNKNITLSEIELNKLKSITKYLTDETINKKGVGSSFVGIVEMEFDY